MVPNVGTQVNQLEAPFSVESFMESFISAEACAVISLFSCPHV